eukprot:RCo050052
MAEHLLAADGLLLLSATMFGLVLVPLKQAMNSIGPFTFNAVRFVFSSASLVPLLLFSQFSAFRNPQAPSSPKGPVGVSVLSAVHSYDPYGPSPSKAYMHIPSFARGGTRLIILGGCAVGFFLFLGSTFLQWSLVTISASKVGFISGLSTVLTPAVGYLVGEKTGTLSWVGSFVAMVGLYLLSVTDDLALAPGDILALIAAMCWTLQFVALDIVCGEDKLGLDPTRITLVQFVSNTVLCVVTAFAVEEVAWGTIRSVWVQVVASGVIEAAGFLFQAMGQRLAPAGHVALVMSLETAFAGMFGAWILGETLTSREGLGCAIMFLAVLLVSVPASVGSSLLGCLGVVRGSLTRHPAQPREAV